jgi:hypothetical protein
MSNIIELPTAKNVKQPKPVDVLDYVISTLEALQSNSHFVLTAIALLGEEKRAREEAERNAK